MKLIVAFVLLFLLGCGQATPNRDPNYGKWRAYPYTETNSDSDIDFGPDQPTNKREYVIPPNTSNQFEYPRKVYPRRQCFGYVNRNGGCYGTLKKYPGTQKRCFGSFDGGQCSGNTF